MRNFYLKTKKSKEVISKVLIDSLEDAIDYFCQVKKLDKKSILSIYMITDQL